MATFIVHPAETATHANAARVTSPIVGGCGTVAYGLVALLLRLVAARDFFLAGQAKVVGPAVPVSIHGFDFAVVLPAQLRDTALRDFAAQFASAPFSPTLLAYGLTYAEFVLPLCLVIGFGTRIAAALLLIVTVLLQIYVAPEALWTQHIYWASLLLVLITCGGGALSLDRLLRQLYQK
jgi:putative oxidoreductase